MKKLLAALGVALALSGTAWGAGTYTDELGESPQYWYAMVRGLRSFGSADMVFEKSTLTFTDTEREGSLCAITSGSAVYGKDFSYGTGDWTMVLRARSDDANNAVIASFGEAPNSKVGSNITLASGGAGKVTLSGNGGNAAHADLITANVADASSAFHIYAIQRSGKNVSFWVDGVKIGEVNRPGNPGSNKFQFFGCYGGLGNSGFVVGTGTMAISEFRFYTKALSVDDMKTIAYPPCDELGYRPVLHLTFNGEVKECEDSLIRFAPIEGDRVRLTAGRSGAEDTAYSFDGTHKVLGIGIPWGANTGAEGGDWTMLIDAKVESTDNAVIFYGGAGSANSSFSLASGGAGKVTLSAHSGTSGHADRITANVADAASAFHRYAIVRSGNDMSLWVDGVSAGTITRADNPSQNQFALLSPYAAATANGFVSATQSAIDDFRVYKRALTESELLKLSGVEQDELGETPVHWLKLNGNLESSGKVAPTLTAGTDSVAFGPADAAEKTHALGSGSLPEGGTICWRSGSWTIAVRAKSVDTDNAVIAAFGPSSADASNCFALTSGGSGRIVFSGYSTASPHGDLISGEVPTASSEFNWYVIRREDGVVTLWAKGEKLGELVRPNNPTINQFALFTLPGGLGSGFVHDDNVAIDDFRVYERALTDLEICRLAGVSPITDAWWTGAAGDGDVANVLNWCCTNSLGAQVDNVLPRVYTRAHFTGALNVNMTSGMAFECSQLACDCTLSSNLDWSGIDHSKLVGTVDLAGHQLTLASLTGAATITDTVGGGELHLVLPTGVTDNGNGISLTGQLKLVKEGPGTYVATKAQSYNGGTVVATGIARFGANGNVFPFGATGSAITVAAGATLDVNGKVNGYPYPVTMAGGVLANSGSAQSMTVDSFSSVTLTADTTVALTGSLSIRGQNDGESSLDLGGHTLTVNGPAVFRLSNCTASNGTVVMSDPQSTLTLFGAAGNQASTVDFDLAGSLAPYQPSIVGGLTLHANCLYQTACPATTTVTRVFKSYTTQFQNIQLADGATLDVSDYDGIFPLVNTAHADREIIFATGARVTVDVHGRELHQGDQILSWTSRPEGVSFRLDAESALHHGITAAATGLYVTRGLIIILQ